MKENGPSPLFTVFMAVWVVLGLSSLWFFTRTKDAALKRKVHRWGVVGVGLLFTGFVFAMSGGQLATLLFGVPAVVFIGFLNIRMTKFCNACGAMRYNPQWFTPMRFCSKCGAAYEESDTTRDGSA